MPNAKGVAYTTPQGQAYEKYISSPAWAAKRKEYWASAGRSCKVTNCGSTEELHVHHHTYVRLGNERLDDLVGLCKVHHDEVHARHDATLRKTSLTTITEQVTGLKLARAEKKPAKKRTRQKPAKQKKPTAPVPLAERHRLNPPLAPCSCKTCRPPRPKPAKKKRKPQRALTTSRNDLVGQVGVFKKDHGQCLCRRPIKRGDAVQVVYLRPSKQAKGELALQLVGCFICSRLSTSVRGGRTDALRQAQRGSTSPSNVQRPSA